MGLLEETNRFTLDLSQLGVEPGQAGAFLHELRKLVTKKVDNRFEMPTIYLSPGGLHIFFDAIPAARTPFLTTFNQSIEHELRGLVKQLPTKTFVETPPMGES
jgi:hypothetical protein